MQDDSHNKLSRRALAQGAAWAVPTAALAATAPALAASPPICEMTTLYWPTGATPSPANVTVGDGGTGLSSITSQVSSTNTRIIQTRGTMGNFTGLKTHNNTSNFGGIHIGSAFLVLDQANHTNTSYQRITITFPAPVHCLSFYIADIDTNWCKTGCNCSYGAHADKLVVHSNTANFSVLTTQVGGWNLTPSVVPPASV